MTKPEGTEHVLECAECGRPSPPEARGWRTYLDDDEQAVTFCEPERAAVADASRSASESRSPRLSPLGCVHGVLDPEQVSVMEKVFRFSLHGRAGTVTVTYRTNEDPERWGYGVLDLPWPSSLANGLPVLEARVSSPLEGYAAVMGWIQVVRIHSLG